MFPADRADSGTTNAPACRRTPLPSLPERSFRTLISLRRSASSPTTNAAISKTVLIFIHGEC